MIELFEYNFQPTDSENVVRNDLCPVVLQFLKRNLNLNIISSQCQGWADWSPRSKACLSDKYKIYRISLWHDWNICDSVTSWHEVHKKKRSFSYSYYWCHFSWFILLSFVYFLNDGNDKITKIISCFLILSYLLAAVQLIFNIKRKEKRTISALETLFAYLLVHFFTV